MADALELGLAPTPKRLPGWVVAAGVALLFVGIVGYAKVTHRWQNPTPEQVYFQLMPSSNAFSH